MIDRADGEESDGNGSTGWPQRRKSSHMFGVRCGVEALSNSTKAALLKLERGILTEEEYSQIVEAGNLWEQEMESETKESKEGGDDVEAKHGQAAGTIPHGRMLLLLAVDSKWEIAYLALSLAGFCIWCSAPTEDEKLTAVRFVLYTFHLLDVCSRESSLRRIMLAITLNARALLSTGVLALVLIYIYAALGFSFFRSDYDVNPHYSEEGMAAVGCRTFGECLLTHLNSGLRSDQGIADVMDHIDYREGDSLHTGARLLFDVSYWIVIVVMLLSIVSGIIIDTFGQLRDRKGKVDEELGRRCFICGNDSNSFQRSGRGFDYHVAREHNMWNYMFVRQYLRERNPQHFTGQERYLNARILEGDISFFPMGQALALADDKGGADGSA